MSVEPKSKAEKSGFKAGDVIIRIGNKPVERIDDIGRTLRKDDEGDKVDCEIIRKGSRMNLAFEVPEMCDLHDYYFDFGTEDSGFDRLDLHLHDIPWEDLNHIDLDRHRFHHNMDILRKNLQRMGRTLRDDIIKMRDTLQKKLQESVDA